MKLRSTVLMLITTVSLCAAEPSDSFYPHWFGSRERAETYAHSLFAGGDVELLRVAGKDILILYVHGSGVPNLGIAAYRQSQGMWEFAAKFTPPTDEVHRAVVTDRQVIIVGEKTKQQWQLLKLD